MLVINRQAMVRLEIYTVSKKYFKNHDKSQQVCAIPKI